MPKYTWHRDINNDSCIRIDCDIADSAHSIRNHLAANGIQCNVQGTTVIFAGSPKFMEVIRASEPFVGTRLISENV